MNIFLIGMPGSGKTTISSVLASRLNFVSIDLDKEIEKKNKLGIIQIFEQFGEKRFRDLESERLAEISLGDNQVIALGGGTLNDKNIKYLNGIKIWIDTNIEIIKSRIDNNGRPLLSNNSLEELYIKRKDMYKEVADIIVDNNTVIDEAIRKIVEGLKI